MRNSKAGENRRDVFAVSQYGTWRKTVMYTEKQLQNLADFVYISTISLVSVLDTP